MIHDPRSNINPPRVPHEHCGGIAAAAGAAALAPAVSAFASSRS